ncbi:hypothetical protein D9M70_507420 [compost metagenome]
MTTSLTRSALAAGSSPSGMITCLKRSNTPDLARRAVDSTVSSSSSEQSVLKCSTPSGVATISLLRPSLSRQACSASAPTLSVRAERPIITLSRVVSTSPPSARPLPGRSRTVSNIARSVGSISMVSLTRVAAPGRNRIAPSVKTSAGSSTKIESGKASSAGSTVTFTPASFIAAI